MSVEESGSHPLLDFRGMGALRLRCRMIERFQQVIHPGRVRRKAEGLIHRLDARLRALGKQGFQIYRKALVPPFQLGPEVGLFRRGPQKPQLQSRVEKGEIHSVKSENPLKLSVELPDSVRRGKLRQALQLGPVSRLQRFSFGGLHGARKACVKMRWIPVVQTVRARSGIKSASQEGKPPLKRLHEEIAKTFLNGAADNDVAGSSHLIHAQIGQP